MIFTEKLALSQRSNAKEEGRMQNAECRMKKKWWQGVDANFRNFCESEVSCLNLFEKLRQAHLGMRDEIPLGSWKRRGFFVVSRSGSVQVTLEHFHKSCSDARRIG